MSKVSVRDLRPPLSAAALLERWRRLPAVDAAVLRADVDRLLDPDLPAATPG